MSLDFNLMKRIPTCVFDANYTHNVTDMWRLAGVYDALYNSEGKLAGEILNELKAGLHIMVTSPDEFKKLNPDNGWGSYESAVPWLRKVIEACEENPDTVIEISK